MIEHILLIFLFSILIVICYILIIPFLFLALPFLLVNKLLIYLIGDYGAII